MNILIPAILLLFSFSAWADFTGIVVKVSDGDTIQVQDDKGALHKVRLTGIDAPEKRQDYGLISRDNLSKSISFKPVTVKSKKIDRYGRELGVVIDGDKDVNLEQIRAGMAWHYKAYERDQSVRDRAIYSEAEKEARKFKYGLWNSDKQIPPWDYRKGLR